MQTPHPSDPASLAGAAVDLDRRGAPGFVGRQAELQLLASEMARAVEGGGRLILIAGEPGIGKSRLMDEFARQSANSGANVQWGRCWEAGGAPAYWPWVQILRGLLRSRGGDEVRESMADWGPDLIRLLPELRGRLPDLPSPPSADPEGARFRLFAATAELLTDVARGSPVVLAVDDLHAADVPSVLLLRFLTSQLTEGQVLILGAYRDVALDPGHPVTVALTDALREPAARRLDLRGLAEPDVARFVEAVAGQPSPERVVTAIHEVTDGNPLFVGEAIRLLAAEGRLNEVGVTALRDLPLPAGISETIQRRLRHLSPPCRALLSLAAVLGRELSLEALQRLSDRPTGEVLALLNEAAAARVLVSVPGAIGRLRFAHALIRDAIHAELSVTERQELHRRAGEALEGLYRSDLDPHLAELAHHFCEAAPGGNVDKAVRYARAAGDRALRLMGYEEASRLYRLALMTLDLAPDQELRGELLLAIGDAEARGGSTLRAREFFLQAAELARSLHQPELLARAALGYGGRFVWARASGDPHIVGLLEGALDALDPKDSPLRVRLLARLAGVLRDQSTRTSRWAVSEEAVEMARRLGDPATLAYALEARFAAIWEPSTLAERVRIGDEMVRLAEATGDEERVIQAHGYRAHALIERGDMGSAAAELITEGTLAGRLRQPAWQWLPAVGRAALDLFHGRFAEAERAIPEAQALGVGPQAADARVSYTLQMYVLRRETGGADEMLDRLREAVRDYVWYPMFRCVLADLHVQRGDRDAARVTFEDLAKDEFSLLPVDSQWLFAMSLLPEVAAFLGDAGRAEILYRALLPFEDLNAYGVPEVIWGSVSRPLGILATTMGRFTDAERHLRVAAEANSRMETRPWTAWTQHDHARLLMERKDEGDLATAGRLLREAIEAARGLGMTVLERRASGLLETVGEPAEPAPEERSEGPEVAVFRREGDSWSVAFRGRAVRLRHTKGLGYLRRLLATPGREIHVAELASPGGGGDRARVPEDALSVDSGHAGEVLDPRARAAYQHRIEELREDIDEAERWHDAERGARAREEMEFISTELAAAYGLGGRPRRAADVTERIRKAVTNRIRASIAQLERSHPELGRHLSNAVATGTFCSYTPDRPISWRL